MFIHSTVLFSLDFYKRNLPKNMVTANLAQVTAAKFAKRRILIKRMAMGVAGTSGVVKPNSTFLRGCNNKVTNAKRVNKPKTQPKAIIQVLDAPFM